MNPAACCVVPLALSLAATASAQTYVSEDTPGVETRHEPTGEDAPVRAHFSTRVSLDGAYWSFFSVPVWALGPSAAFGVRWKRFAVYGVFELLRGRTEWGLGTWTGSVAPEVAWKLGRFQLAVGPFMSLWLVHRITQDSNVFTLTAGVRADASVDLIDLGDFKSIYLGVGGRLGGIEDWVYGGVLSLGFRL